ncbi:MAG TPA: RNA 2',3'-cyclic phosphodiesterase [Beijerinckiaceae bacterium]|nr:RNA 2',3'-cyclic phosphodiesterase [Beijerinckiaceae bacterium]
MPRLFTGIELPQEIAGRLAELRGGLPGARWLDPSDYHITLRFAGDIDRRRAEDFAAELADIRFQPMVIALTGLASFGGGKPHSVHVSVAPNPALIELSEAHERAARRAGLAAEKRKFVPHVTLARLRGASTLDVADYLASRGGFPPLRFMVQRFVLFSAREQTGGGPYIIEAAFEPDRRGPILGSLA